MRYPIAIKPGDASHTFTVMVPDMPSCSSSGDTLEKAISNAREAVTLSLQDIVDAGRPVPRPSTVIELQQRSDYADRQWAWLDIEIADLDERLVPVEIWLPERLVRRVWRFLAKSGEAMTSFVARAMVLAMGQGPKSLAARGRARENDARRAEDDPQSTKGKSKGAIRVPSGTDEVS